MSASQASNFQESQDSSKSSSSGSSSSLRAFKIDEEDMIPDSLPDKVGLALIFDTGMHQIQVYDFSYQYFHFVNLFQETGQKSELKNLKSSQ
jgi:hypothetical protein